MVEQASKQIVEKEKQPKGESLRSLGRISILLGGNLRKNKVTNLAQSLAYSTILSLVPILAVFFSILGSITKNEQIKLEIQEFISIYLIPEYVNQVFLQLEHLANLSLALGVIGFPMLFVAGVLLYAKVDSAINEIWDTSRDRKWFRNGLAFFMTLFLGPMLLVLIFSIPPYLQTLPYYNEVINHPAMKALITQLIPILVATLALGALYFYIPDVKVKPKAAMIGAFTAAIVIQIANGLLGYYFANVHTLNVVYGSLVTFPIMLLWLFGVWLVVLGGAAIAFVMQYHAGTKFKLVDNLYNDESLLNNALQVLYCLKQSFEEGEAGLDAGQLQHRLGIHPQRVRYIIKRLTGKNYVVTLQEQHADTGGDAYQLGMSPNRILIKNLTGLFFNPKEHNIFGKTVGNLFNQIAMHPIFNEEGLSLEALEIKADSFKQTNPAAPKKPKPKL